MIAPLERDEIRLGRDDGPFFFSCPGHSAARVPRARAILLCMGLFSRFCIQALQYTAREARRGIFSSEGSGRSLIFRVGHRTDSQIRGNLTWCLSAPPSP